MFLAASIRVLLQSPYIPVEPTTAKGLDRVAVAKALLLHKCNTVGLKKSSDDEMGRTTTATCPKDHTTSKELFALSPDEIGFFNNAYE